MITLLGLLLVTACGEDKTSANGAIDLSWAIGGSTCGTAGINLVEVSIYDTKRIYSSMTVACQLGEIQIPNIPAGSYSLRIDGIQQSNALPVYEGNVAKVSVQSNTVTVVPRVYLAEKPGAIDLTWRFDNGSLCTFSGVDTIDVSVWDIHSNRVWRESLPCDPLMARSEAEENEPTRALYGTAKGIVIEGLYAGSYTVHALGMMQEEGEPIWWAREQQVIVQHANLTPVDLVLLPCDENSICL